VGLEVALISGDAVGAIEYSKKIWQQVDQHSTGKRPAGRAARSPSHVRERRKQAHWTRNDSGDVVVEQETKTCSREIPTWDRSMHTGVEGFCARVTE
jgi:hypothetical protein